MGTPVTVKDFTHAGDGGTGVVKLTVPATAVAGNMLIAFTSGAFGSGPATGWQAVSGAVSVYNASNISGGVFWRVATAADAGTQYSFPMGGGAANGIMLVLNGANTGMAPTGAYVYQGGNPATVGPVTGQAGGAFIHFCGLRTSGGTNYGVSSRGSLVTYDTSNWSASAYFEQLSGTVTATDSWTTLGTSNVEMMVQVQGTGVIDDFPGVGVLSFPTTVSGLFGDMSLQAGEPGAGTNSAWAYLDAPKTTRYLASTVGSTSDTILEIYTGPDLTHLTLLATDDDSGPGGTSRLNFNATAGTRYYFRTALKSGAAANNFQLVVDYDNRWNEAWRNDGAVLVWLFDGSTVTAPITDFSNNGRSGSWVSANEYSIARGLTLLPYQTAYRGVNGAVAQSPAISWPASGSWVAVEMMIYVTDTGKATMPFSWQGASLDFLWGHTSVPGYMGLNNLSVSLNGPPVPKDGWHHLIVNIPIGASSTTAEYYVDGVLQTAAFSGTAFTVPTLAAAQFRVGHNTGGWEIITSVDITGVAIYFGRLTAAQAATHARAVAGTWNDNIANYQLIAPLPYGMSAPGYDSSAWTVESGENTTDPATRTAWAAIDGDGGTYQLDTIGSTYDTSVAVYTGAPGALTRVSSDSSSGGSNNGKLVFTTAVGTRYFMQVGASPGASPDSGTIYPRFTRVSLPATQLSQQGVAAAGIVHTAFLLKGRSTKAFDAQAGG